MYVRCAGCRLTTRVELSALEHGVTCTCCGRHVDLNRVNELGSTPEERFRRARAFAREKRIDLASAYSVLLGILSIGEALSIGLDDRNDRGLDAASDRHGTRRMWNIVQVAAALVIFVAAMLSLPRTKKPPAAFVNNPAVVSGPTGAHPPTSTEPERPQAAPLAIVDFMLDADGRVIEVSGPDPNSVLAGLCNHEQFARILSPIGVVPAVPPAAGDRLGLVRDRHDLSELRCVSIHRDFRTSRWFVGGGRAPLEIQRTPTLPLNEVVASISR